MMSLLSNFTDASGPLALAIGQFDGVHLGHQAVFRVAVAAARDRNGIAGCLTFHPHVAAVLDPAHAPPLLATPAQNQALITACGIGPIHSLPFTRALAAMPPAEFLALLKKTFPSLADIVVGQNFTFGKNRAGNAATLPALAESAGLQARMVAHVEVDGAPISSTRIRAAVLGGDLPLAQSLLGHPFALAGKVVRGRAIGRTLGFPTANIHPILPIRPAPGIYAARLHLHDGPHPGAAFVPDPADPRQAHFGAVVEIHLPGFDRTLYDHDVEISFTRRLRGHMIFPDPAAAAAQIARDSRQALAEMAHPNG
ncbi:MAG: riboflavin biosynthesis protein RibF [Kiritimatiellae bacterium]|nr:riboflavin biosynthesis protein RibF [Kiritimatiellia bacterium]